MTAYTRKVFAAAWALLAAGVIVIAAFAIAPAGANAATVTHTDTTAPAQVTCQAFAAWERHQTAASLGRLVTASARLPRSYLKADAFQLAADASSPSAKAGKYVTSDRKYVTEDCAKL